VDLQVWLSVFLCFLDLENSSFFFKYLQDGIGCPDMSLEPLFTINVIINEAFQTADDEV
jgi:hypothetical protein